MTTKNLPTEACATCPMHNAAALKKLGVDMTDFDFVVALSSEYWQKHCFQRIDGFASAYRELAWENRHAR